MENEIPAGSKVKVAVIEKGVTTLRAAEVLAHMDGLVHVDMNGQAVSVDPSQIVPLDAPEPAPPADSVEKIDVSAEVMDQLNKQMAILESVPILQEKMKLQEIRFESIESRLSVIEVWILAHGAVLDPPATAADLAPAPAEQETHSTTDSTAVAATGEAAAGS
jgi:hypothetical protein